MPQSVKPIRLLSYLDNYCYEESSSPVSGAALGSAEIHQAGRSRKLSQDAAKTSQQEQSRLSSGNHRGCLHKLRPTADVAEL